ELLHDLVGIRIDPRDWKVERSHPDGAFTGCNVAAFARYTNLDGRSHFVRFRIDFRDASIALIEGPHGALADGDEPRRLPNGDGLDDEVRPRIDTRDEILVGTRHPERVFAKRGAERSRRDVEFSDDLVRRGIESSERALGIRKHPDAAGAGDDR